MELSTDDHFLIGSDHLAQGKPCQDYALSGTTARNAYAIVADGCSGGGLTDVGARLTALSAAVLIRERQALEELLDPETFPQELAVRQNIVLVGFRETLGLTRNDMLATCLYAYLGEQGGFVHVRGDGVVAFVHTDGCVTLIRFDWNDSRPFYPAYLEGTVPSFVREHGGADVPALRQETWTRDAQGTIQSVSQTFTVMEGIAGVTIPIDGVTSEGTLASVAVFSDGVTQVDGLSWTEAALELLSFKSPVGLFAKRRMIRFSKEVRTYGKGPLDDIAYAVIHRGGS